MSPAELVPYLRRRPFEPFRVVTSEGVNYEIHHPEMAMPVTTSLLIAYPNPDVPGAYLRFDLVSMFHILRIEQLPVSVNPQGNGSAS
jgi:hypothetical protein